MSLDLGIWLLLFLSLFLGVPIFVSLGMATFIALTATNIPLSIIPLDLFKVSEMFPLIAVPAFILAGALMERGGIAQQIVDVCSLFVGRIRGGLGLVTILGCMFFAAMIGSGPSTVAAMGALMIPSMIRRGYDKDYAAAVTATGGTLGILIPPSNPMIVYGVIANVSISGMFMAGFIPGAMVGTVLMVTAYLLARRRGYKGDGKRYTVSEAMQVIRKSIWALMAPIIILGGIYTGIFTPIEASMIAILYSFFVGTVITKKLKPLELWESLKLTSMTTGVVLVVVSVSMLFGRFITMYQVPQRLTEVMLSISTEPTVVLLLIFVFLFFLGMFMETLATIAIVTPIVLPLLGQLGIHPIHFGIFLIMTNEIAMLTPPLGVNLFVAMGITKLSLEKVALAALPYVGALIVCVLLVIQFPQIVLWLPQMLGIK
ncbi:TRAP transporter large permease [Desulfotomaculum sp. 1211_IL3151]|uniref:TRAP transporter large permease n=1 Tax=Desulfotomaculum sp. 1211_IL3151 TaxID=3084055 RepID=UPI002FDAD2E6